jgi:hypothetical protein
MKFLLFGIFKVYDLQLIDRWFRVTFLYLYFMVVLLFYPFCMISLDIVMTGNLFV